ncbi:hypothetical protein B0H14DRAFT_882921 [Mycena olivaceomarginata]|nr:hypothetical protein B0H14DRAFT_882921 [Mycena olivaceomarginata]
MTSFGGGCSHSLAWLWNAGEATHEDGPLAFGRFGRNPGVPSCCRRTARERPRPPLLPSRPFPSFTQDTTLTLVQRTSRSPQRPLLHGRHLRLRHRLGLRGEPLRRRHRVRARGRVCGGRVRTRTLPRAQELRAVDPACVVSIHTYIQFVRWSLYRGQDKISHLVFRYACIK